MGDLPPRHPAHRLKKSKVAWHKEDMDAYSIISTTIPVAIMLDSSWTDEQEDQLEAEIASYTGLNRPVWFQDVRGVSQPAPSSSRRARPDACRSGLSSRRT